MTRTAARTLSIAALVVCVGSVVTAATLHTIRPDAPSTDIVVVGDPAAPRMQEVLSELEREVAGGGAFGATSAAEMWIAALIMLVFIALWLGTGVLIVFRRPSNWAGWLFIITGAAFPVYTLSQALMFYGLRVEPGSVPLIGVWATVGEYALYPVALIPLLFLLYPDGRVPSPAWRWAVVGLVGGTALAFLAFLLRPGPFNNWVTDGIVYENPLGVDAFASVGAVIAVGTVVALAASLSTVVAVVRHFRRSSGEERQQMRVLAFVAALAGAFLLLLLILGLIGSIFDLEESDDTGGDWPFELFLALTALTIVIGTPVAYLVAIFRYRLWELDVVIKKTIVFGMVATVLTLIAVLVLLVVPVATVGLGASDSWLIGLGVALGLLFMPLRRLGRRVADRFVYGERATPYEVLTSFSERVGETYSTEDVLPRMVQVLANGTGATFARVLLRVGGDVHEVARWPEDARSTGDEHVVPVMHLGEELGALAVRMPANDPIDPAKEKLIADLAAQTGLVLRNVRLIEDLRASRQRLVAAQDEERRKLERNIHDGAQQQLVALQVKQRLVEGLVEQDPERAKQMLSQLQAETASALEDLRDLARGIYPPLLADEGLAAALRAQARKSPVPIDVRADVGRYPQDVEAAVYFCALEALNNVSKYARATRADVTLVQSNGALTFEVRDDGIGFDAASAARGSGLQGMADRLEAIGGALRVESEPGRGTIVRGVVRSDARGQA